MKGFIKITKDSPDSTGHRGDIVLLVSSLHSLGLTVQVTKIPGCSWEVTTGGVNVGTYPTARQVVDGLVTLYRCMEFRFLAVPK